MILCLHKFYILLRSKNNLFGGNIMYHRKNIDLCLSKEFFHLSNIEDEKTKIKCLSEFFHLDLDSFRYSDKYVIS